MMEEKQLKDLFLFRKLGAFSVVREKPREAMQSIRYASEILNDDRSSTLWIFPQGEILPNDLRPLKFYNGLSKIIKNVKNCETTSLSIRYEFLGEFKPEIFVKIEKPSITSTSETSNSTHLSEILAQRLTVNLDSLNVDVVNQNLDAYKSIL
jgi:1-acyl-sn-glycerol-3-phosphate acyltransferase